MSGELEEVYESELETEKEVIKLISLGKTPSEIQAATSVPPRVQREIRGRFQAYAQDDIQTQARTKEALAFMEEHFTYLIREMQTVAEEADDAGDFKLKKEALREQANIIKMRIESLQKAGLLNADGVGDQLVAMETEKAKIIAVLKGTVQKFGKQYPDVARYLVEQIASLSGEVTSHRVVKEDEAPF